MAEDNGPNGYREKHAWGGVPDWDSPHVATGCDHPVLRIVVRGQQDYYCLPEDGGCGWVFQVDGAIRKPISWLPAEGFFALASFVKRFGKEALMEGLMRPFPRRDAERIEGRQTRQTALPESVTEENVNAFIKAIEALGQVDLAELHQLKGAEDWESEGGGHGDVNRYLQAGGKGANLDAIRAGMKAAEALAEGTPPDDRQLEGEVPE